MRSPVLLSFFLSKSGAASSAGDRRDGSQRSTAVGRNNALSSARRRILSIITTLATLTSTRRYRSPAAGKDPDGIFRTSFVAAPDAVRPLPTRSSAVMVVRARCRARAPADLLAAVAAGGGSDEVSRHRLVVEVEPRRRMAYVISAIFASLAGLLLAAQVASRPATVGGTYNRSPHDAVVLGVPASTAGRGAYLGAAPGRALTT